MPRRLGAFPRLNPPYMDLEPENVRSLLERSLELARQGWGKTHPNPMVGALVVEGGEIVAEGFHHSAGCAHAEVEALRNLGRKPREGAALFVSLEPCSTSGRTPPCTDAIIGSGIGTVIVGCEDPNPLHAGRGLDLLRAAGIRVEAAEDEFARRASRLNFIFNHKVTTGEALVALKIAETSNGMVAEKQGVRSAVTGEDALGDVMIWRRLFPAICVGAGTVASDDPSLTARIEGLAWSPVRIVVDGSLSSFSENLSRRRLYSDEFADRTIVVTSRDEEGKESRLKSAEELGVRLWRTDARKDGRIPPASLRLLLRELSLNGLYCEGGPQLARSILAEGEADYLFRYRAPKVFDGPDALPGPDLSRHPLKDAIEETLGEDHLNHGFL